MSTNIELQNIILHALNECAKDWARMGAGEMGDEDGWKEAYMSEVSPEGVAEELADKLNELGFELAPTFATV